MTVAKFDPIYRDLPEIKAKRSASRDNELLRHLVRHLGDKRLSDISREDLFDYIAKRRKDTLFRGGDWTKIPVSDGCIKNELACLRRMLNLARMYKEAKAKEGVRYDVSTVSFTGVMPESGHRERVLKDGEREQLLKTCPLWLKRLVTVALETCLSRGDLLRLSWDDIDEENGVIVPDGGRLKTSVRQAAPLTKPVREVLAEIENERKRTKVQPISSLIFVRSDGHPITGNMVSKALRKVCDRAGVRDFRLHDSRHTAKTAWARRGIPVEAAMLGAGHKSVQMHKAYVHLQASDVGKAFGTATNTAPVSHLKRGARQK